MIGRRSFLRWGLCGAAGVLVGDSAWLAPVASATAVSGPGPYGDLQDPDENGIRLPAGFRSRRIARSLETVPGTSYTWPIFPDGGATFSSLGGWIYVANSEIPGTGGVGALRFDRSGNVVDAYPILENTIQNCAGGRTPWHTWLSCEEYPGGYVWECDPDGRREAVVRHAMGRFQHEAVAADPEERRFYLTEDVENGGFYRFTPTRWKDLSEGLLEIASVDDEGRVRWSEVPEPNPEIENGAMPTRYQVEDATAFRGGEGITVHRGKVYFTTKGDNRVWEYDVGAKKLGVTYDASLDPGRQLTGVDNIEAGATGDLIVAEDGGNMELVVLTPQSVAYPLLQVVGQDGSELTGPSFSPDGSRLYFSSQRAEGVGATYEVTGPFPKARRAPRARRVPRRPA